MKRVHATMQQFAIADGEIMMAGRPISALAADLGTPFYAYDSAVVTKTLDSLRQLLPQRLGIHYALKANPFPALVNFLSHHVDGFDVASAHELKLALASGMPPAAISLAGPGKTDALLQQAVSAGIRINVESTGELERIARLAPSSTSALISLRVNPDISVKAAGMRMGGGASPFGIDVEQVPQAIGLARSAGLTISGLHYYPGSQILHAETIVELQRHCLESALQLAAEHALDLRTLNLGGGFGIPYFPGEQHLDPAPIAAGLHALLARAQQAMPELSVHIELGRYLVGEAGLYVTRILDRKVSRGKTFLITDGGMNHHLAASGNLGQVLRRNYPVVIANRMIPDTRETVTIAGPLCTPLDVLAENVELPHARPGDLVAVYQSGAYGYSASPHGFLSHPLPQEILL